MAKFYKLLAISCWLLAASCQEGREAGDLWGQWRLADGDRLYISFSGHVARLQDTHHAGLFVYGNFQHRGDSLFIQCFSKKGQPTDTVLIEKTFGFRPFSNIRLKIDRLDGDNLVLSKDNQRWSFYKY